MKNESMTGGFGKLKQDLAGMTFRQKAEHLWTYYRSWVIIAGAVVLVLCILGSSFINLTTQTLVAGVSVNLNLEDGVKDYMITDLEALLKNGEGRQKVYFETAFTDAEGSPQDTYYLFQNMLSLMADESLDYMLLDQEGVELFLSQDPFMDLRELFTPQELQSLNIENVKASPEAEEIPALVNISDWPVVKQGADSKERCYFVIVKNTPRLESVKTAFAHLQGFGAE